MTIAKTETVSSRPRVLQFRLGTLLLAMVWVGLVCLAIRTPTALMAGLVGSTSALVTLVAVLVAIYRTGRARAAAIGFALFCGGNVFLVNQGSTGQQLVLRAGAADAFSRLGDAIHGSEQLKNDQHPWMIADFGPGLYNRQDFISICANSLATLLGLVGSLIAQALYATRKSDGKLFHD